MKGRRLFSPDTGKNRITLRDLKRFAQERFGDSTFSLPAATPSAHYDMLSAVSAVCKF